MKKIKINQQSVATGVMVCLLLATTNVDAQVAAQLQEQEGEIKQIAQIIVNIVLAIFGCIALVQAIMVFISSGQGEDKIKKAGTYIFMLVFVAVGYYLSTKLFN